VAKTGSLGIAVAQLISDTNQVELSCNTNKKIGLV